jgi:uncharacterized protein YycO
MNKIVAFAFLFIFHFPIISSQANQNLKEGDLFFQDLDCGSFCDAIEAVTEGKNGLDYSHVGILYKNDGKWMIAEAGGKGVVWTSLDSFKIRSLDSKGKPKILHARLKKSYQKFIPKSKEWVISKMGKTYDDVFDLNNDQYYCSELVYWSFYHASGGNLEFKIPGMTFKDPKTQDYFPIWVNYFKELGIPIPEGKPGLNPGGLSKDERLEIIQ